MCGKETKSLPVKETREATEVYNRAGYPRSPKTSLNIALSLLYNVYKNFTAISWLVPHVRLTKYELHVIINT